jgi:peptide/nickel transport system permease protein
VRWVKRIFTLDFGDSFQDHRPVIGKIKERLPITLALNIISILLAYLVAIPLGIYSAAFQGSRTDRFITFTIFMLYSLPSFWVATMGIVFLCGGDYWHLFPPGGISSIMATGLTFGQKVVDVGWHLVLPVACLTYGSFAFLSRQMRVGMLEVIRQDYIRTARAKGLSEWTVITKHALRNSLIPVLTIIADILPALIGGSVIIETIFSIPGMGRLGFEAILYRDYPVIMAVFTVSALLTLVGFLVSDLLYALVDPRISFKQREG